MEIVFADTAKRDERTHFIHTTAIVDGSPVECQAGPDVMIALGQHAKESGIEIGNAVNENANFLRPYWAEKIKKNQYDDSSRSSITLSVDELLDFLRVAPGAIR